MRVQPQPAPHPGNRLRAAPRTCLPTPLLPFSSVTNSPFRSFPGPPASVSSWAVFWPQVSRGAPVPPEGLGGPRAQRPSYLVQVRPGRMAPRGPKTILWTTFPHGHSLEAGPGPASVPSSGPWQKSQVLGGIREAPPWGGAGAYPQRNDLGMEAQVGGRAFTMGDSGLHSLRGHFGTISQRSASFLPQKTLGLQSVSGSGRDG